MTSRNVPDIHQKHPDSVMTNVMPRKKARSWVGGLQTFGALAKLMMQQVKAAICENSEFVLANVAVRDGLLPYLSGWTVASKRGQ